MDFTEWLEITAAAERSTFGVDPREMDDSQLRRYLRDMFLALADEVFEALHEVNWKPWRSHTGEPVVKNGSQLAFELSDALHFVANIVNACGISPGYLTQAYLTKVFANANRAGTQLPDELVARISEHFNAEEPL